jgi:class 3 adenylate cyclase/PAS domain-containing protein
MGEVENDHEAEYNLLEFADTIEEERSGKRNPVTSLRIKSKQRKQSRQVSTSANAFDSGDENPHVSKDTDEASASNAPSRKNSGVGGAMDVNGLALQEAGQEESEASKTFATYSHRAETHSSAAVDRLVVVVLVCLIIYCVAVIFCFVITEVMLGSGTQSANLINRSGQLRYLSQATFLDTRKISQNLANAAAIADLKTLTAKAVDNYLMVRGSPDTQIPGILEAWQKTYQVRRYQPDTGVQYVETAMYLDFLRAYYMQTATIGDGPAKLSGDAFNVSARYILDNGMGSMLTAAKTFTTDIVAAFLAGNSVFQAALWVEPSLLAIPVILILFIFAPSYRAFRKERHELLAVMAAVPKSIARAVHTTLSMHGKSGNDDGDRLGIRNAGSLNSRSRKSSLKRFTIAFFSLTILVMAIVVIFSVLGSVYVGGFTDQSHEVDFSGERRMLARRISALLGELQSFDPLSWSSYSQVQHSVREALDRLAYLDRALRYGSASLGLPGSDGKNSAIDDAYYLSPCTKDRQVVVPVLALNSSYTCVATASLLESFMASASNILSLSYTDPSLIPSNSLVAITQDLEIRALAPRLHGIVFLYETQRDTQQDIIQAIAITSFTLGFPLGLLLLYLTFKHLQRLREEEREILRVLLCIPVKEIVENDSLRTVFFCDEGRQSAVETAAVEQDVDREKYALLQSAMQDPVIELSYDVRTDTSRVEKMNNKARRLFGRNHSAALGGDFLMLFAQSSHAQIRNTVRDALAASSSVTSGTNLKKQSKASMHGLAKDSGSRLLNGDDQCSAEVEALSDSQTTFPCRITVACAHSKSNVLILLVHDLTQERLRENLLLQEKAQSQSLLENALPKAIALRMRNGEKSIADAHAEVTLFFSDIVGFTSYSSTISATELVTFLNEVTCECDALLDKYHITKIKTIGDALFVATGLPEYRKTHAEDMVGFALEVLEVYRRYNEKHGTSLQIRVGIHTGPVAAGVIGSVRYAYDVWGDSVNLASRMESTGVPGRIQVTRATYEKVYHLWDFEEREVYAKGKGTIQAYVLKDPKHPAPPLAQPSAPPNDNASHSVSVSSSSHGSQPHISVTEIHAPPRSSHARSRMTSGDYGRSTESFDAASLGCGMSDPGPLQS